MPKRVTKKLWRVTFNKDTVLTTTVDDAAGLFGTADPDLPDGCTLLGWTWEVKYDDGCYGLVKLVYPGQLLDYNLRNTIPARMRPVFVAKEVTNRG